MMHPNPMKQRTTFRTARELFHADNCEPLKQAAAVGDVSLAAVGRGEYPGEALPEDDLHELCMAGYWSAQSDQNWGLDWHCNEGIEIGFLSAGSLPLGVGGKFHQVEPGHLTITRPWQRHCVGDPNVPASHYSWVILDVGMRRPNQPWHWPKWVLYPRKSLDRLTEMLRLNEQPVWRADRHIAGSFKRLDELVQGGDRNARDTRLKIIINELLIQLAGLLESSNPKLDQSLSGSERTVRLFLENLHRRMDEPWTLDSMAESCGLGRTHFASYCKRITNVSPIEFLTRVRLSEAARLLAAHPEMRITEIAFHCGFQSSQYFTKVFRRHHGHAPSRHRGNTH